MVCELLVVSIYSESIIKNRRADCDQNDHITPVSVDFEELNSLLSDEDQGLGEMDGCDEIHLSYSTPIRKNHKSKPPDLVSVKPQVKVSRRGKK